MIFEFIEFCGHDCFKTGWSGFRVIKPINVIIGKNNTGKSRLLDLVESCCSRRRHQGWKLRCEGTLNETSLKIHFSPNTTRGQMGGNHWLDHGRHLVGKTMQWQTEFDARVTEVSVSEIAAGLSPNNYQKEAIIAVRKEKLRKLAEQAVHVLDGLPFRRLLADRDIRPEQAAGGLNLDQAGNGATNIIRKFLTSQALDRELVRTALLKSLNEIFGSDGEFDEIAIKLDDRNEGAGFEQQPWEIFLGEKKKGLIPLSRSGSGLKTIFLVLLNLMVIPEIEKKTTEKYVFAFEELENNLHPTLLRRLFRYLEKYAIEKQYTIFLTTHSSIALDLFGSSPNAQITHVAHDGESATAKTISTHFDRQGIISQLGARPSDLLQANGIIWAEGPSDRIYINRWIELLNGDLREGREYQCAFYGGAVLACTQFKSPEEADSELANLMRVNSNLIVVCDSDRSKADDELKARVKRIRDEVSKIPNGHIWILEAREIENYLPGAAISAARELPGLPDPGQFEPMFPRTNDGQASYCESRMKLKGVDKTELALECISHLTQDAMKSRFDWYHQMSIIVNKITTWNR